MLSTTSVYDKSKHARSEMVLILKKKKEKKLKTFLKYFPFSGKQDPFSLSYLPFSPCRGLMFQERKEQL